jgi:hypothetical protein
MRGQTTDSDNISRERLQGAIDLGHETAFSAQEAARGIEDLIAAGLTWEEAMRALEMVEGAQRATPCSPNDP